MLLLCACALAQEEDSVVIRSSRSERAALRSSSYWGIGVQLGLTTGTGLQVSYVPSSELQYEATFLYFAPEALCIGGEVQYALGRNVELRGYRTYSFLGGLYARLDDITSVALGVGVGIEAFLFTRNLGVSLELALTLWAAATRKLGGAAILPLPQVGLAYHFR